MGLVDLKKKAAISLEKKCIHKIPKMQVGVILDVSGSMESDYNSERGTSRMYDIFEKCMAVATQFDDDGNIDLFAFDNTCKELPSINEKEIDTFDEAIKKNCWNMWRTTKYAGVLKLVYNRYFEKSKWNSFFLWFFNFISFSFKAVLGQSSIKVALKTNLALKQEPVFILFFTDGANDDFSQTLDILEKFQNQKVFIQFISIGPVNDKYLRDYALNKFADHSNIQNVIVSDEEFFDKVFTDKFKKFINTL